MLTRSTILVGAFVVAVSPIVIANSKVLLPDLLQWHYDSLYPMAGHMGISISVKPFEILPSVPPLLPPTAFLRRRYRATVDQGDLHFFDDSQFLHLAKRHILDCGMGCFFVPTLLPDSRILSFPSLPGRFQHIDLLPFRFGCNFLSHFDFSTTRRLLRSLALHRLGPGKKARHNLVLIRMGSGDVLLGFLAVDGNGGLMRD
jgi:hypothetical protein